MTRFLARSHFVCFLLAVAGGLIAGVAFAVSPATPPIVVAPSEFPQAVPVVAALSGGDFVVVFEEGTIDVGLVTPPLSVDGRDGDVEGLVARILGADGAPRSEPFLLNVETAGSQVCARVAADASTGGFVAGWIDAERNDLGVLRRFAASGEPTSDEIPLPGTPALPCSLDVTVAADGTATVVARSVDQRFVHRVSPEGEITTTESSDPFHHSSRLRSWLVATSDGGGVVASSFFDDTGLRLELDRFTASGELVDFGTPFSVLFSVDVAHRTRPDGGDEILVATSRFDETRVLAFVVDPEDADSLAVPVRAVELPAAPWNAITGTSEGQAILVNALEGEASGEGSPTGEIMVRSLGDDLSTEGPVARLAAGFEARFDAPLSVAATNDGQLVAVAWERRFAGDVTFATFDTASSNLLDLGANGRFEASVTWRDFDGNVGSGTAVPLAEDTGAFWFFDPANLELTVKVLDGRAINGHFWVFQGSLTNVEYTLEVRDTVTSTVYTVTNPLGQFGSFGDVEALPAE